MPLAWQRIAHGNGGGVCVGERPLFELHHSASHIIPNTLPMMSWDLSKTGAFCFPLVCVANHRTAVALTQA